MSTLRDPIAGGKTSPKTGGTVDPELIAAVHVTGMMYLEQRARQGEDTGELDTFRRCERRKREAAGYVADVDARFRVSNARRWWMPWSVPQGRHRRAPASRRRAAREGRSRSGRGSPPGDPDDSDPGGDHLPLVAGATTGAIR